MARINFTVEGLIDRAAGSGDAPYDILRTLIDHQLGDGGFDPATQLFSVEIDPAAHSFADVRRAVADLGKRKGLVYLAVVMSP
ncbi:MAG TPA: hypothetical protein VKB84_07210 [Candidatus Binataceae bacterium]|nr:hypothetical protein [Candidatus Binataceae bacterium]